MTFFTVFAVMPVSFKSCLVTQRSYHSSYLLPVVVDFVDVVDVVGGKLLFKSLLICPGSLKGKTMSERTSSVHQCDTFFSSESL